MLKPAKLLSGALVIAASAGGAAASCSDAEQKTGPGGVQVSSRLAPQDQNSIKNAALEARQPGSVSVVPVPDNGEAKVAGYAHSIAKSRFSTGSPVNTSIDSSGIERRMGPNGVVALFPNGFFAARPLPESPSKKAPPLTAHGDAHNAHVLAYFLEAGVPASQLGPVHANALMVATGSVAGDREVQHLGFVSVVDRVIDGFRIEGSFAWAQFNASGDVVAETVWWPPVPAGLVQNAHALKVALTDSTGFSSRIPARFSAVPGEVVIHHAAPVGAGWYVATTVDYALPGEKEVASFDSNGVRVHFSSAAVGPLPVGNGN